MQGKYIEISDDKEKVRRSLNTLFSLVNRNVRNQYRNSVLGVLWTVLNPLLNMVVIALVFSLILNRSELDGLYFPVYILSGNIVFGLLRNATVTALPCMVRNYDLLSKTRIVHEIFPISNVLSAVVNFFFALIALFGVMLLFLGKAGVGFHLTLLLTPLTFLPLLILFCLGLSFLLSAIYIRFRDIEHIYSVVLTLWSYLTPLFYSFEIIKGHDTALRILKINPMYHFVVYFRDLLMGRIPSLATHALLLLWGVGSFFAGFLFFHFSKRKFLLYI